MSRWQLTEAERRDLTELLAALIRHPSPDPPGDESDIAPFVAERLTALGFRVETDEFMPGRINVLARIKGGGGPALVFSAHVDTMPTGDGDWRHPPFAAEIADGRLYGRGAADMKSGLAAMIAAAAKLAGSATPLSGDLVLAFSAGESTGCIGAKRMLETGALADAGWLLVSEPTSLDILTAETGALWLEVTAHGETGHASGGANPLHTNAIRRLIDFLETLPGDLFQGQMHPLLGQPSLAVNGLHAGHAPNIAPDRARATLDIRTLPGQPGNAVIDKLAAMAGDGFSFQVIDDKPPVETPAGDPFVATCADALAAVTGAAKAPGGVHYFSDSNVLVPALGIPRVIIGPGELGMSGRQDEWVSLDALADAAAVYAEIAARTLAD